MWGGNSAPYKVRGLFCGRVYENRRVADSHEVAIHVADVIPGKLGPDWLRHRGLDPSNVHATQALSLTSVLKKDHLPPGLQVIDHNPSRNRWKLPGFVRMYCYDLAIAAATWIATSNLPLPSAVPLRISPTGRAALALFRVPRASVEQRIIRLQPRWGTPAGCLGLWPLHAGIVLYLACGRSDPSPRLGDPPDEAEGNGAGPGRLPSTAGDFLQCTLVSVD